MTQCGREYGQAGRRRAAGATGRALSDRALIVEA